MGSVVATSTITLASSPSDVWPFVTDTDRMNRLLGQKPVAYRAIEKDAKGSARFVGETSAVGLSLRYEEAPFEWTHEKSFSVYRKMRSGPLKAYTFGVTLAPTTDGGTDVTVRLEMEPRFWFLRPIAALEGGSFVRKFSALAKDIDAHVRDHAPSPYLKPASPANHDRLAHGTRELTKRGLDPAVVEVLASVLREGSDADLARLRPFQIAEERAVSSTEMLRVMLHAVTAGLVELRWSLVCPSCRTGSEQVSSLSEITDAGHCQLCDIQYGIELDRAVEATFVPHPSVRDVPSQMFCIGGPSRMPHVLAQSTVDASSSRDLSVPEAPGRYRLFARGGAVVSIEVTSDVASPDEHDVTLEGDVFTTASLSIRPGGTLHVHNATNESRHVKIERLGYASLAATAHVVTTMDEFRRLFSRELLKSSTPLKVSSCAILFSDLTGSTALYTKAGDAAAFRLVDDHFDVLRKAIAAGSGTVVKTMGDAIMAAFVEPHACVRTAVACLRDFEMFRKSHENGAHTGLKLGLFTGPCYVITANETIDYFGQTVNCASRVQHLAESGEIVFEESVFDTLPDEDRANLHLVEKLEARVKGVEVPLKLVRTRLA